MRRHRYGVAVATTLVLLLTAFGTVMAVQARRIAQERDRANREAAYNAESWLHHVEKLAEFEAIALLYAVLTEDEPLATQVLDILGADERIRAGCAYLRNGKLLAQYPPVSHVSTCPPYTQLTPSGHRLVGDRLEVWRPVLLRRPEPVRQVGIVWVAADRDYAVGAR